MTAPHPNHDPKTAAPATGEQQAHRAVEQRQWLSALVDGDAQALAPATAAWRDDSAARDTWHVYHLIGDMLRSEDLVSSPARDAAFLAGVRQRLAAEPVPLAPSSSLSPGRGARAEARRLGWRAPAAVAAGFAVVAAGAVMLQPGAPLRQEGVSPIAATGNAPEAARGLPAPSGALVNASSAGGPAVSSWNNPAVSSQMLRDSRLDAYLSAHQAVRGSAVGSPVGGWRNVEERLAPSVTIVVAPAAGASR